MPENSRQVYNNKILEVLRTVISEYPDLRFHQILQTIGIIKIDKRTLNPVDQFYEESKETYESINFDKIGDKK